MTTRRRALHLLVAVGCLLAAQPSAAAEGTTRNLVDAKWLEQHRHDADLVILDASAAPVYAAKHIPGALHVDAMLYGGKEVAPAEAERLYRSWGVNPDTRIVMYDQGGSYMATRLLFALLYHGFPAKNLLILDGGMSQWAAAGLPVTADATPAPKAGSFTIGVINEDVRVRLPEFLTASGDPANNVLLEALGPDWHFGATAPFHRAGHPPNGVMLPSADLFNADKTFKSPEELRRMLRYLNIRPDQHIYTYCGGGVAASAPFFALKFILGYPDVKLYPESELGWLSDPRDLPYWTYDAPFLVRDARWLQWTGGQMVRAYLGAPVSIVDVRPADAFGQGHVPFALNIPADVFRRHVGTPAALAEVLGAAGVDAALEAVVVSGAGLTPDAALAFLMLEQAGQAKTSVFVDSIDAWTKQGLPVSKTPTAVGTRKGPGDVTIEVKPYPLKARTGILVADAAATRGLYPKVFIASGASLPARAFEGTVVHVPYTELLTADGTPKAAKDLWTILTKAGVPRYGELVCVSDDPGEAAVTYFILRMMGYPDAKVLAM